MVIPLHLTVTYFNPIYSQLNANKLSPSDLSHCRWWRWWVWITLCTGWHGSSPHSRRCQLLWRSWRWCWSSVTFWCTLTVSSSSLRWRYSPLLPSHSRKYSFGRFRDPKRYGHGQCNVSSNVPALKNKWHPKRVSDRGTDVWMFSKKTFDFLFFICFQVFDQCDVLQGEAGCSLCGNRVFPQLRSLHVRGYTRGGSGG